MNEIRWGIVGCGNVTEVKSGPGFSKSTGSKLIAVMRRNGALAEDYAKRHNVPKWYDDADKLIHDPQVDAVYVATPPGSHLDLARKVAAAGKPCYMEKPMARSFAECQQMNQAFERAGQKLFVAYYRRAMPRFVKLKEYLDTGRIGRITGCRYQMSRPFNPAPGQEWRIDAENSGGGLVLDVGSHVLDYLDYALGEFVEFSGTSTSSGAVKVEDIVALQFRTGKNVVGTAHWNFAGSREEDLLEIEGTEGRLWCNVFTPGSFTIENRGKSETVSVADPPHVAQPLIQTVVDDLLGKGTCPSTGQSGARTSKYIDAALSGFYNGRDDEFWKRPEKWRH